MTLSRRAVLAGLGCSCIACGADARGVQPTHTDPSTLAPLLAPGFRPSEGDERGLWQQLDRAEGDIADSPLRVRDPALERYVGNLVGDMVGDNRRDLRCYIVRIPLMNASMAPNGMMTLYSGALLRIRDEAELAAVLGHESGHYLRRHSIASWRQRRDATSMMAFISVGLAIAGGAIGGGTSGSVASLNNALALSTFRYQRDQEAEADAYGLKLAEAAGYQPHAASRFWRSMIAERDASARLRGKRREQPSLLFSSHPSDEARMTAMQDAADRIARPGRGYRDGATAYADAMAPHRMAFLDDEIKRNDPGISLYIINSLAAPTWTGALRYREGEVYRLRGDLGDETLALAAYTNAVALSDAPPEANRACGYALLKAGRGAEGKAQLLTYLARRPDADDRDMIAFTLNQ